MAHNTKDHICTSINCISRSKGTGKVDPVYYNAKAPKNQPFFIGKALAKKVYAFA